MQRSLLGGLAGSLLALLAGSCAWPVAVGTAVTTTGVSLTIGESEESYPATVAELDEAVRQVFDELDIRLERVELGELEGTFVGHYERPDDEVLRVCWVSYERLDGDRFDKVDLDGEDHGGVAVRVRTGWYGDEPLNEQLIVRLRAALEAIWLAQMNSQNC